MMDKQSDDTKRDTSTQLAVAQHDVSTGLKVFNLLDERQLAQAEVFLKKIIATDKGGIKSVNEGLAVLMRAQDLQLPFSTCIEHIHVINGKTGIDVHIAKALLLRAGVTWECVKDYTPQYQYTDGNTIYLETQLPQYCVKCRTSKEAEEKTTDDILGVYPVKWYTDLKGAVYNEFQVSDKCVKALNRQHALKLAKDGAYPIIRTNAQPVDFVTEYKFTRIVQGRVMTVNSHFSFTEAQIASLFDKDTYKKYARVLIGHRAFTLGGRDIGADVLMGCLETTELKIMEDMELNPEDVVSVEEA